MCQRFYLILMMEPVKCFNQFKGKFFKNMYISHQKCWIQLVNIYAEMYHQLPLLRTYFISLWTRSICSRTLRLTELQLKDHERHRQLGRRYYKRTPVTFFSFQRFSLTEQCKSTIVEKNKNHKKQKNIVSFKKNILKICIEINKLEK